MKDSINYIKNIIQRKPKVGIIIGSGLSAVTDEVANYKKIEYKEIPSFIDTTIDGHMGEFIFGNIQNTELDVIFANGRFHYYEGLTYKETHLIIDIFSELGCEYVITTNSSGCLESKWSPGDLMVINSHIDMTFRNECDKPKLKNGEKYYNAQLRDITLECMEEMKLPQYSGTYGWTLGPTYETKSEIKFMRDFNIKAVGMSTVPEIERCAELDLNLVGISCLTNYAVGITTQPLTHDEVVDQANRSGALFTKLILKVLQKINQI